MQAGRRIPRGAVRVQLPSVVQALGYTCGAAAILSVCGYFGVGPRTEAAVVRDMGFGEGGSDPAHLIRAVRRYGLRHLERRGMTDAELRDTLDRGSPVILMVQAWGGMPDYRYTWTEGHWIVAIGHDACGVYVEDPMIDGARGYLSWRALAERWHDLEGRTQRRVHRYGLILWQSRGRLARSSGRPAIRDQTSITLG